MTELDALRELQTQMSELLWTSRVMFCGIVAGFAASAGMQAVALRRVRRLEARQARLEAWQQQHGPPLERLALEQDAASDQARAVAVRRPQRAGSPEAPL
ncbi:hypothetical protein WMF30_10465 [Sorangium sp. So ce134]